MEGSEVIVATSLLQEVDLPLNRFRYSHDPINPLLSWPPHRSGRDLQLAQHPDNICMRGCRKWSWRGLLPISSATELSGSQQSVSRMAQGSV